jgi:hypothetical protein
MREDTRRDSSRSFNLANVLKGELGNNVLSALTVQKLVLQIDSGEGGFDSHKG